MVWLARPVYLLRNSWTVAPCYWAARTFRPRSNALHSVNPHESNPQYYVPLINRNVDPFSWIIFVCINLIFVSFPRDVVSSFSSSCFCTPDLRRLVVCPRSTRQYNSHAYTEVQLVFAAEILRQARRGKQLVAVLDNVQNPRYKVTTGCPYQTLIKKLSLPSKNSCARNGSEVPTTLSFSQYLRLP